MNKIYQIIWNKAFGAWVPAPEGSKAKRKGRSVVHATMAALALLIGAQAHAYVAGSGATVTGATQGIAIGDQSSAAGAPLNVFPVWPHQRPNGTSNYTGPGTSIAFGYQAFAQSTAFGGAMAFGQDAYALGRSLAFGPGASAFSDWASAYGALSFANNNAVAFGTHAYASGDSAVSVGMTSEASGYAATAMGLSSSSAGRGATALGLSSSASDDGGVALGAFSHSQSANSLALGSSANALGTYAAAVGYGASASNMGDVALGASTKAAGDGARFATALGSGSEASTSATTAVGALAKATQDSGTAVGYGANASEVNSTAIGKNATASTLNSVALGADSSTGAVVSTASATIGGETYSFAGSNAAGTVSIGSTGHERTITNVAAGRVSDVSTDAVNGSQLYATNSAIGNLSDQVTNIDLKGTKYFHANSTGADSQALGADSIAIGMGAVANSANDVALGTSANAQGDYAAAVGYGANASEVNSTAIGKNATASTINSVALGADSSTGAVVSTAGATVGGETYSFAGSNAAGTVSVGSTGHERTITNVAAGRVSDVSTDAVNGSQLHATNSAIDSLSDQVTNVDLKGTKYFHANSTGVDSRALGADSVAIGMGAVANSANDVALGSGSITTGSTGAAGMSVAGNNYQFAGPTSIGTVSVGAAGQERTITNVAAGRLGFESTDAVNGSQLWGAVYAIQSVSNALAQTNQTVANLSNKVNGLKATGLMATRADAATASSGTTGLLGSAQAPLTSLQATAGVNDSAVAYNVNADGTPDYNNVTLNGDAYDANTNQGGTKITNVAVGSAPSDAVNYAQFNDAITRVTNIAQSGGTPFFAVDGNRDIELAVASGDHAMASGANARATGAQAVAVGANSIASSSNSMALGANTIATGDNAVALGAGSIADQANTVSVGSSTQQRRVTNVAQGTSDTDAVNVAQLNQAVAQSDAKVSQAVQSANAYTDQQFSKMSDKMNSLGAAAMAATSLIPNARAQGNFQMAVAAGTYGNASALAIGANFWATNNLLMNVHLARSTGSGASTGASIGATYGF
ncbi:YadA domain-containing protein [Caballeronia arvi]|uniref:YadA domain-containing protein n=2 Tax=Caballeronia arvi TaxID=1777135 RepID=A0A158K635_9BURK|nr:YadA domain-containing protein [Caballeronia arvi]